MVFLNSHSWGPAEKGRELNLLVALHGGGAAYEGIYRMNEQKGRLKQL